LITEAASGETEAIGALYERYGAASYALALKILGDSRRAEDVVQESFLRIWMSAGSFDAQRGSVRGWLLRTVRNRSIDHLRGRCARERAELELSVEVPAGDQQTDPWREVALAMERDAIRPALRSLPAEQRQVVELAYYGGYSHREIAELLDAPLGTVKSRARSALEKLHSYLQGRGLLDV